MQIDSSEFPEAFSVRTAIKYHLNFFQTGKNFGVNCRSLSNPITCYAIQGMTSDEHNSKTRTLVQHRVR